MIFDFFVGIFFGFFGDVLDLLGIFLGFCLTVFFKRFLDFFLSCLFVWGGGSFCFVFLGGGL